jgi:ABC-type multidrug transport system fused ATPase/permease subunit
VVEGRVTRDLRNDVYSHLLRLGFPFFQRTRAGQIITRVTNDVDQMRALVTGNLAGSSRGHPGRLLPGFLLAALVEADAGGRALPAADARPLGALPPAAAAGVLRVLDAVGEVAAHLQETVSGIRLVKASGAEEWESRALPRLTQSQYKA